MVHQGVASIAVLRTSLDYKYYMCMGYYIPLKTDKSSDRDWATTHYGIPPDMEFGNYLIKGGCEDTSYLVSLLFLLLLIYLVIQTIVLSN